MNRPPSGARAAEMSKQTLAYYETSPDSFWEATKDHDVSQNISSLLAAIPGPGPHTILDLGCGPGRDLSAFTSLGHRPTGLDGCSRFCDMARSHSGCEVWNQDFLSLELPSEEFDGIFANASLFHIPSPELPRVLAELRDTLRPGGILFASNPRGANVEEWSTGRYRNLHDLGQWSGFLSEAGFEVVSHYFRPAGHPREEQPWLATVSRRLD